MRKKRLFITFEGPEGSGKSTHAKRLSNLLRKKGYSVILLREPGGTKIGEQIRKILLDKKNREMGIKTELFLYLASRTQLIKEKIIPALKKGKIVILDRYHDSTVAYQGYGGGVDLDFLEKLGGFVNEDIIPDLTFLLDIETKKGLKRCGLKDRIEKKTFSFHQRVRKGYLELAKKNPQRIFLIKVDRDIDSLHRQIEKKVFERILR